MQSLSSSPTTVQLPAPISGILVPLESVPDPVFAQKMVGDGISIDPLSNEVRSPCDGEIVQLHPANHAVTIKSAEGLLILVHVGLDTVNLHGQGFNPKVKQGDRVATGDVLIEVDLDYVALHAKSLLTQVVITNSEQIETSIPRTGQVVAGKDTALELTLKGTSETLESDDGDKDCMCCI